MSDKDPWGYDAPMSGDLAAGPTAAAEPAEDTLDDKLDNSMARFSAVGNVRKEVLDRFIKMIDSDPEAIVSVLRQTIHHGAAKPGGE
ncbi:MAG: hypothetical protein AAF360_15345 [Pseudomonadota bacterium]